MFPVENIKLAPDEITVVKPKGRKDIGEEAILNSEGFHITSLWSHIAEVSG
jgi:hypothetical protein